jgi:hypothetical protein
MSELLTEVGLQVSCGKNHRRTLHSEGFSLFGSMQITFAMLVFGHQRNRTLKTLYSLSSSTKRLQRIIIPIRD